MEKTFKRSFQNVLLISSIIYIIALAFSLLWFSDLYEYVFKRQLSATILAYIGLLLLIILIVYLFSLTWESIVKENVVIEKNSFLFFKRKTYSFYNSNSLMIEKTGSLIMRFSNLENFRIYDSRRLIADIEIKKDEEREIYNLFNISRDIPKKHYEKDKNFVYNGKSFLSLFEKPIVLFVFLTLYDLFIIGLFNVWTYRIERLNMNITIFTILLMFISSLIYGIVYFIHNSNTNLKIDGDTITSMKGRIFFSEFESLKSHTNSYIIKQSFISRLLDIYYISFKLTKTRSVILPLHKESLDKTFNESLIENTNKNRKYYFSIILSILIGLIISVPLMFISIPSGIIIILFSSYTVLSLFYSDINISNNRIIIRKLFIRKNLYSMDIRDIKKVKIRKVPFNHNLITFYTNGVTIRKIVDNNMLDNIKSILGYFKK